MATVAVIVSHPDDELLGVGGTIRRHVDVGDEVWVHIENCRSLRDVDARLKVAESLAEEIGYSISFGASDELSGKCRDLSRYPRDIIYTHHPADLNRDHRAVAEAALVAGRFARTVRCFETVSSTEWGLAPFEPDYYVGIDIDAKCAALAEYASEMREPPHPRSEAVIRALAAFRGSTVGLPAAEAFHTVRDTWR